eukprot:Sspe_Gene.26422::Locus_10936_Transcript_1_1_Confidence_1.000_Length_1225::g.26422::m.26422
MVGLITAAGAKLDVKAKNTWGNLPVHAAVESGHAPMISEVVKSDPSLVNARNNDGSTPLHLAACDGKIEVVRLLVELGADVEARNDRGENPSRVASLPEVKRYLKSKEKEKSSCCSVQ